MMIRIMIVALLIGSGILGWLAWGQHKEIAHYEEALAPDGEVEQTVQRIQRKAYKYTQYNQRKVSEGVKGDANEGSIAAYVRSIAQEDKVKWGVVKVGKADRDEVTVDGTKFIDTSYRVTAQESDQAFDRNRIANFLYLLEDRSKKIKVTSVDIKEPKRTAPHEIPNDLWEVDLIITVRERAPDKGKGRG